MKKAVVSVFVLCFMVVFHSVAQAVSLEWWYIQHRTYEDGSEKNVAHFAMKDANGDYILENVVDSITLKDPSGNTITLDVGEFGGTYKTLNGAYDTDNGRWYYADAPSDETYYRVEFSGTLTQGTYSLTVTDTSGNTYEASKTFNGAQELSVISSDTFCAIRYDNGDLMWKWASPMEDYLTWGVSTSVRTRVEVFDDSGNFIGEVYLKVPTHMGWVYVPGGKLAIYENMGGSVVKIRLHLRTNDNNNRAYSNKIDIRKATACGCDVSGDQKIGLAEAIHALQVVAGVK